MEKQENATITKNIRKLGEKDKKGKRPQRKEEKRDMLFDTHNEKKKI